MTTTKSFEQVVNAIDALFDAFLPPNTASVLNDMGLTHRLQKAIEAWNAPAPQEDVLEHGARLEASSASARPTPDEDLGRAARPVTTAQLVLDSATLAERACAFSVPKGWSVPDRIVLDADGDRIGTHYFTAWEWQHLLAAILCLKIEPAALQRSAPHCKHLQDLICCKDAEADCDCTCIVCHYAEPAAPQPQAEERCAVCDFSRESDCHQQPATDTNSRKDSLQLHHFVGVSERRCAACHCVERVHFGQDHAFVPANVQVAQEPSPPRTLVQGGEKTERVARDILAGDARSLTTGVAASRTMPRPGRELAKVLYEACEKFQEARMSQELWELLSEAASRLEGQEARIAELNDSHFEELDAAYRENADLKRDREALKWYNEHYPKVQAEIERVVADNAALRATIERVRVVVEKWREDLVPSVI